MLSHELYFLSFESATMKIYVQRPTGIGRLYNFDVEPTTTIKQLKQCICEKDCYNEQNVQESYFTFDGDILDRDERTLMSYGVEDNSLLELVDPNMKFRSCNNTGNRFVDVCSTKGLKQAEWSRIAPRWRRAGHGLCFEGQCLNKECEAYRHTVIMPIGYQKFDILIDTDQETTICPLCKY
ncbi:unnamed protein product [Rotaria sp. Silwood1]|nr:unnamed protein product [Rotaria sp. Silwood1]